MSNELTGRELAERINRANEIIGNENDIKDTCGRNRLILIRRAFFDPNDSLPPDRMPRSVAVTETSDDILAELAAAGHRVWVGVDTTGSNPTYQAGLCSRMEDNTFHAPTEALRALRTQLIPSSPVPMTKEDVEEIMGRVPGLLSESWKREMRDRLMRHVSLD